MIVKDIQKGLMAFLLPAECQICKEELAPLNQTFVCRRCWSKIEWITPPYCQQCARPLSGSLNSSFQKCGGCLQNPPNFERSFIPTLYRGVMVEVIKLLKYKGKTGVMSGLLRIIEEYLRKNSISLYHFDLVIPVPLHRKRLKERGFNQAELIARVIANYFHLPLINHCLKRIRPTQTQTHLRKSERIKNIKRAFRTSSETLLKKRKVLLVDDVYTTGVTANQAAGVLKRAGVDKIYLFALARAS